MVGSVEDIGGRAVGIRNRKAQGRRPAARKGQGRKRKRWNLCRRRNGDEYDEGFRPRALSLAAGKRSKQGKALDQRCQNRRRIQRGV